MTMKEIEQQNSVLSTQLAEVERLLKSLQNERDKVAGERDEIAGERDTYKSIYLDLLERYRKLEKGLLDQKTERLPKGEQQLSLGLLAMMLNDKEQADESAGGSGSDETSSTEDDEIIVQEHKRKRTGRNPLPENLPRVVITVVPPEVEREGLDAFERLGEEVSEVIERRPATIVVVETVRPKFVRKDRDRAATTVYVADAPELPIPKGRAGPGLLADTLVRRWQDHLPLNRLEGIYAREGIDLARSTICSWHDQLRSLVKPLVEAMWQDALTAPYLCTDATGVLIQAKEKCRRGHFWVVIAPEKHVLFGFSKKHNMEAVDDLLRGYEGFLVADAHVVYDHLYDSGDVVEVGCWAHARRYFFKAMSTEPELARRGLSLIGGLFRIERQLEKTPRKKKKSIRQRKSKPVVDRFFEWCEEQALTALDETPISKAIGYARNQSDALKRFLDDGRLPIHNNGSELQLRRQAIGRKNWLFVGSDDGAEANTLFVSLLASCQMNGVEPWSYLRDLLCLLPSWPACSVLELAPLHWKDTSARLDVQKLLDDNVYRWATTLDIEDIAYDATQRATSA